MNLKRLFVSVAAGVAAAAVWVGVKTSREQAGAESALQAVADRSAVLSARMREVQARVTTTAQRNRELQSTLDGLRAPANAPAAAGSASGGARMAGSPRSGVPAAGGTRSDREVHVAANVSAMRECLRNDPQLQALYLKSSHARLRNDYGPFFASLRLTPEQVANVTAAMVKQQEQFMDLSAVADSQGVDASAAVGALRRQAAAEYETTQRALLGDEGFRQLREYERAASPRMLVKQVAGMALEQGEPITPQQAEQLTLALANASERYPRGGSADVRTINWAAADMQARMILTPAQLNLFQRSPTRAEIQLESAIKRALEREAANGGSSTRNES